MVHCVPDSCLADRRGKRLYQVIGRFVIYFMSHTHFRSIFIIVLILLVSVVPMVHADEPPATPVNVVNTPIQPPTTPVNVVNTSGQSQTFTIANPLKVDSIGGLVSLAVEIFTYIVILFGVLMLVWVGFQYILARGNTERMKELSKWLTWIVVGIAIVIGARVMVQVIINTLETTGTVDSGVIRSANNALNR